MRVRSSTSPETAAEDAADVVAARAVEAIDARGRFVWAVSGGSTPGVFLAALARRDRVDWSKTHLFQVDERIAATGSDDRNDTMIRDRFVSARPEANYHPLPVVAASLGAALIDHLTDLERLTESPARLDLVQLGLGGDGHTASLVPDDPVLDAEGDLATTGLYNGTRRVTMTAPLLNRARERLFLVTGAGKDDALGRLAERDPGLPGSLITDVDTVLVTDRSIEGLTSS
ncbi:MAG: 6-phosphogluconolactonase [Actinomycetota bacterium]